MTPNNPSLEVRGARASSVIVQSIPPDTVEAFMEWQRNISDEAAKFPGYLTTELYPAQGEHDQWVAIVHFADSEKLKLWIDSPQRASWVAKIPCKTRDFQITTLPTGLGDWFAGLNGSSGAVPTWKAGLTVLLGLYPTVMLLHFLLVPHTQRFAPAYAILIGNAASVIFLQWLGMPALSRAIRPWLDANGSAGRKASLLGAAAIIAVLLLMAFLLSFAE